ncbi:MAG: MATE family efflux transporter [Clostridia bacterium]|nr:MATE family efflux transporter [Clostridia bacterium]
MVEEVQKEENVAETVEKENKMGVMPVNKLLIRMGVPMMISMLVQALYNIVDSIFVAKLGQDAFNAVSFSFPVQNILIAIASGTGVGMNALISRALGEKNGEKANGFAMHGLFLAICSSFFVMFFGIFGSEIFFRSQTTNESIIQMGTEYTSICCIFSFGVLMQVIFERLLQSTGKTTLSMITQSVGAIINIIFDPILIFGLLGFPKMGVAGAAIATVLGQIVACVVGLILNVKYNRELTFRLKGFRIQGSMIKEIYRIGFPSIIMQSIGSVMTYMMNRLLSDIEPTETAAAVFGAYFKLQSFVIMPVFGLGNAMTPIVAYNLGARKKARLLQTYRLSVGYAVIIMTVGAILMIFAPKLLLGLFSATDEMLEMGASAFRIIAVTLILASVGIMTSNLFQACGKSVYSLLMSLCRQLLVLIPLAYLFGYTIGYKAVWFAIPLAEVGSLAVAVFGYKALKKKVLSTL